MQKSGIFLLLFFMVVSLVSQNQWNDNGVPVRQGVNIEWARSAFVVEDGSIIYVWSDTRLGDRDVWGQKVSPSGELMWGEPSVDGDWKEGILINGEINRQEDIVIIGAGNNEVIVAWVDFRHEDDGDIYAQKIGADGTLLWEESGVPISLAADTQISLNIVSNDDGGAYIIWLDSRMAGGTNIFGTHILSDGTIAPGWEIDGNPIVAASNAQTQHTFWEDGEGGAIVVWKDERDPDNKILYAQRMTANNPSVWQENGIQISDAQGEQGRPNIRPDGTGNFMITWRDRRHENVGDIYAQRIDINGNILWEEDLPVYVGSGIQTNPRLTYLHGEGCIVTWEDGRNSTEYMDIYAQKILPDGSIAWNPNGIPIVVADNDQKNPRVEGSIDGGAWIIWDDARVSGHPHEDIYIQKVDSAGNILLEENGKVLCDANRRQYNPLIKPNTDGLTYAIWADARTGSTGMYVQILDENGNETLSEDLIVYYGLEGDALQFRIHENDDNPIILWVDTRNAGFGNQIYMQLMNTNADFLLQKNGKPVTAMTGYNQDALHSVFHPTLNMVAVVWKENRGVGENQVFTQAVDTNGNSLWNDMGISLGNYPQEQDRPKISIGSQEEQNFFYAGWSDFRSEYQYEIYGQKLDEFGNLIWDEQGVQITNAPGDSHLLDVIENYYLWQTEAWPGQRIYVKKVDENGNTAAGWPEQGLQVGDFFGSYIQTNAKAMLVPEGIFVIWIDQRNGKNDIYGQLVSPEGESLWDTEGFPIVSLENDRVFGNILYDEDIYIVWEDFRNGLYNDIFMQKMDMNANFHWEETGLPIVTTQGEKVEPYVVNNDTHLVTFWKGIVSENESDLYAQALTYDGDLLWDTAGYVVCDAIKNQSKPNAVTDNSGNIFVIWEDARSSGKTDIYNIYAQMIRTTASDANDTTLPSAEISVRNYPNPFNPTTTIEFNKPASAPETAVVNIFNVKGQLVQSLSTKSQQVTWDGMNKQNKSTATGVYFYQVQSGDYQSVMKKMVLLK